jgi:hypothetical protein
MIFRSSSKHTPSVSSRTESTVSVGDLLQFKKRAEQPPPEFWTDFECQLKERQRAAAIQEKHPWWQVLPRIALAIPASATAALAIGFIVWRNAVPAPTPDTDANTLAHQALPHPGEENPTLTTTNALALARTSIAMTSPAEPVAPQPESTPQSQPATIAATESPPARPTAAEAAAAKPVAVEHLETARTAFASITTVRPQRANTTTIAFATKPQTTKTTSTAALFSMPVVIDSDLIAASPASTTASLSTTHNPKPAESTATGTEDPADARRERLLTYADNFLPAAAASVDNPRVTRLRNRVTSRFDDKSLSDSISRIATTGDSLTIKF